MKKLKNPKTKKKTFSKYHINEHMHQIRSIYIQYIYLGIETMTFCVTESETHGIRKKFIGVLWNKGHNKVGIAAFKIENLT